MKRLLASLSIAVLTLLLACTVKESSEDQLPGTGGSAAEAGSGGAGIAGDSGEAGEAGTSSGGSSETGGSSQAEGGAAGSSGTAGTAGAPAPTIPLCQITCTVPADCTTAGSYPAEEWQCDQGLCRYLGCASDNSCLEVYKTSDYVCRPYPGSSTDMCQKKCNTNSDCALDTGAWSADNWNCQGDYCVYTGCTSDLECKASMAGLDFRCRDMPALGYKSCIKGCNTPADCAVPNSPAWAASTYECKQGACEYLGCPNDAACQQSMNSPKYVCK